MVLAPPLKSPNSETNQNLVKALREYQDINLYGVLESHNLGNDNMLPNLHFSNFKNMPIKPKGMDGNGNMLENEVFRGGDTHAGTLVFAHIVNQNLGSRIERFTAFNDKYHVDKNSSGKHPKGLAFDFTIKNRSESAAIENQIYSIAKSLGIEGSISVRDEYKKGSPNKRGDHMHVAFKDISDANLLYDTFKHIHKTI